MTAVTLDPTVAQAVHLLYPHNAFEFEQYLSSGPSGLKLATDDQLCRAHVAHLTAGAPPCPLGPSCPLRHTAPGSQNFRPPARDPHKRTVCKHWLRGLCKKGDQCDYLHEYDMRRMPECRFFATFGFCNSADECLYLHVDPKSKIRSCEWYERGFCPKGPDCPKKHIRRPACPLYLAGFCPKGKECKQGHPKTTLPSAESRRSSPVTTHRPMTLEEAFGDRGRGRDGDDDDMAQRRSRPSERTGGGRTGLIPREGQGARRYANNAPQQGQQPGPPPGGFKRELSEVLCFKCNEYGHFANMCPNAAVPGQRGGVERASAGRNKEYGSGRGGPY
ncbi:related to cleavage and polyadenylation specificity factor [Ceraceosorus bombacis]|uniref:mRNA 3'-end-processing protein n=1 Tax=Ceraceosorus bombacis TaxID=401625 RepID=A0A0P1B962_9BASI|nr:related to cleavage and polyadenylation specificity factor [Ceraceosorus bombacis]